jgi:uncharacterized protein (TIGR03083 family)
MAAVTAAEIERKPLIAALAEEWSAIEWLLAELPEAEWGAATCLPGWDVADVVAHVVGTEAMLLGEPTPEAPPALGERDHVRNDIAGVNEQWVESVRTWPPVRLLERYRSVVSRRLDDLGAMDQAAFDAPSWTPVGPGTYGRFMQIRLFDCWMHEQDIRSAVSRPGHEDGPCAEGAVDEIVRAAGYLVGKRAGAPDGSSVRVELTGPVRRRLDVVVDGRARLVDEIDGTPTARVKLDSTLFTRLAGGRVDPAEHLGEITLGGDRELALQVATHLSFTV